MEPLLSVKEVAALLRISRSLLYQLVLRNEISHLHIGKRVLFVESALKEWVENKMREGGEE